jgi:hypothetical protein
MTLTTLAWLCMAAYALHIMEEFMLNWRDWARNVLKLPVEWPDFYVTNGVVIALGIAMGGVAADLPIIPLAFAALMLINAVFFHIGPVLVTRKFSPGTISAVLLFLPLSATMFLHAFSSGVADLGTVIGAFVMGALTMAWPIFLIRMKSRHVFLQT